MIAHLRIERKCFFEHRRNCGSMSPKLAGKVAETQRQLRRCSQRGAGGRDEGVPERDADLAASGRGARA